MSIERKHSQKQKTVSRKQAHEGKATETFEKSYAQNCLFKEYKEAKERGEHQGWIRLQNAILRSEWTSFLDKAGVSDLRKISQYLARQDGRAPQHFRPSCLAPLKVDNKYKTDAQEKAETLARHFARKVADGGEPTQKKNNQVRIKNERGIQERNKEIRSADCRKGGVPSSGGYSKRKSNWAG